MRCNTCSFDATVKGLRALPGLRTDHVGLRSKGEAGNVLVTIFGDDQDVMLAVAASPRLVHWDGQHRFH